MKDIWQSSVSMDGLQAAWAKVLTNRGSKGGDGTSLKEFQVNLFANLTQLRADLLSGTYRTSAFRRTHIPKRKGGHRTLTIPSIRDRVVHTSIATTLLPIFEAEFEDSSFAYRPNRGVDKAARRIETWRKRGYDVVIEADIIGYFDNIDQELLINKIEAVISPFEGAAPLLELIKRMLAEQGNAMGTPGKGVVQGSPLSPLLANLYLDALDEEIEAQGVKLVRFADDFVILCKSEKKAKKVLEHCVSVLNAHDLQMHEAGTRIANFDKGFDFIGYLFVKSLAIKTSAQKPLALSKPAESEITEEGVITLGEGGDRFDPGKRVLYLYDSDHHLTTKNLSFCVALTDGTEIIALPPKRVGRIELGPKIEVARSAIDLAAQHRVTASFTDGFGQTKTTLTGRNDKRAGLHLAQAEAMLNPLLRLALAKKMAYARNL